MDRLLYKHIKNYPVGVKNGLLIQTPKHFFKYGTQENLRMNGISLDIENNLNIEMLRDGDLCFSYEMKHKAVKPILHPLGDFNKEIEINGKKFIPYIELLRECNFDVDNMSIEEIEHYKNDVGDIDFFSMMFFEVEKLFEWHFDVRDLIGQGLAIDINSLIK
jgi:hypothetical protein